MTCNQDHRKTTWQDLYNEPIVTENSFKRTDQLRPLCMKALAKQNRAPFTNLGAVSVSQGVVAGSVGNVIADDLSHEKNLANGGQFPSSAPVQIINANPWESLTPAYTLDENDDPTVMANYKLNYRAVAIKKYPVDQTKTMISQILALGWNHQNLLRCLEAFEFEKTIYLVYDHFVLTLSCMLSAPLPLKEEHIGVIIRDVLAGVSHLAALDIIHGAVTSSSIMITHEGVCKVGNLSACATSGRHRGSRETWGEIENAAIPSVGLLCLEMMEPGRLALGEYETAGSTISQSSRDHWDSSIISFVEKAVGKEGHQFKVLDDMSKDPFLARYDSIGHEILLPQILLASVTVERSCNLKCI